jgi:hypothetical protein
MTTVEEVLGEALELEQALTGKGVSPGELRG